MAKGRSHPFVLIEDRARVVFFLKYFFSFSIGISALIVANNISIILSFSLSTIVFNNTNGRIFCHDIMSNIAFIFRSILEIILKYQRWVGHTPIFVIIIIVKTSLLKFDFSYEDTTSIKTAEAKTCTRKYSIAFLFLFFSSLLFSVIIKHIVTVLISKRSHTVAIIFVVVPTILLRTNAIVILCIFLSFEKTIFFKLTKY